MKRLIPTLVAVIALAALGLYVWRNESQPKAPPPDRPDKIYNDKGEDVVEFKTENLEKNLVMTVKKHPDGEWWITDKGPFEADTDAADQMAKHIASPELDRILDAQTDLSAFGVDKPTFRASATFKDGHKRVLVIGKKNPTGTGYFGREETGKPLALVAAWSAEQIMKTMTDLRSKNLTKFEPAAVNRVTLVRKREHLEFKREGDGWRMTAPFNVPADRYTIDALLNDMKGLRGMEIIETDNAYSRYKLDQPIAVVTLFTGTGTGQKITLSKPNATQDVAYASSTRNPAVVKLGSALAVGTVTKPIEEFRDRLLLQAGKEDISDITLNEGSLEIRCTKDAKTGKWSQVKPAPGATSTEFDDMLFEIVYVRVEKFADDAPKSLATYGLEPARFAVSLTGVKDKKPFTASYKLGNRIADHAYLKMSDRPGVVEVRKDLLEKIERFTAKVRAPSSPAPSPAPVAAPAPAPKKK